jgi:hypothetical protein
MSKPTNQTLFLNFSLPSGETHFETASAAVEQLTVFSQEHGDWQVRFRDIPNQIWIPHPMSIDGVSLPCPSGVSGQRAIYRRIDVSPQPVGHLYTKDEVKAFSGFWQPWLPELTLEEDRRRLHECLYPVLRPSLTQVITTAMKCWLPGFFGRSSKSS